MHATTSAPARGDPGSLPHVGSAIGSSGAFYVVQLAPDLAPHRVKLGWAVDAQKRLAGHRTAAPTACLVKHWPCYRQSEGAAIRAITAVGCRALSREAFDELDALVERANRYFAELPSPEDTREERLMDGNELLTVQEVATRLKVNPETVRRWLREGKLRGYLLGGDRGGYRVGEADLSDFLAGRRNAAPDGQ